MTCRGTQEFFGESGAALVNSGVRDFQSLWLLPGEAVDKPNNRQHGTSVVSRCYLRGEHGQDHEFHLKRQRDDFPRHALAPRRLLRWREYQRIRMLSNRGVACLEAAALATYCDRASRQGVLATSALTEHVPLDRSLKQFGNRLPDPVVITVARFLRHMHRRRLMHGNLYPKHASIHREMLSGSRVPDPIRVIDLEDAVWVPWRRLAVVRDLEKLNRYCESFSTFHRLRLVFRYLETCSLSHDQRGLLNAIIGRTRRRHSRPAGIG